MIILRIFKNYLFNYDAQCTKPKKRVENSFACNYLYSLLLNVLFMIHNIGVLYTNSRKLFSCLKSDNFIVFYKW